MSDPWEAHRFGTMAFGPPDFSRYRWGVSVRNRWSRNLVSVDYFDDRDAARAYVKFMRSLGDYTARLQAAGAA